MQRRYMAPERAKKALFRISYQVREEAAEVLLLCPVKEEATEVQLLGRPLFNLEEAWTPPPVQRVGTGGGQLYSLVGKTLFHCLSRPQEDIVPAVFTLLVSCAFCAKTD